MQHPSVSWVQYQPVGDGSFEAWCDACEAGMQGDGYEVDAFAAQHAAHQSPAPGYRGLGDLVASAAGAFGFESCEPCEERRIAMNQWAPRVWRR